MSVPVQPVQLGDEELASVESFRQSKDTAVLTIMFTDIVGFTKLTDEKGEHHSNEVRRLHDRVLEAAITTDGAGVVVKHIGDAIMAVFSEPSTAVERALRIHEGLERLARERTDIDPVHVRIGLDMGQVTVEENVDADVFGRHVNRASRVEGLAGGGQILMTYTVFDSARAWLSTPKNAGLKWASHGHYQLKGVSAPVEIFEVADSGRGSLRAPPGGRKIRSIPGVAWAAGLVLVGVMGTIAFGWFRSTEVWLAQYAPARSSLDGVELRLDGNPGDPERKVLHQLKPGRHVLDYEVADAVRYYAELDLKRGENHVRPRFVESRIPSITRSTKLGEEAERATNEGDYFFYDRTGTRIQHQAKLSIGVDVKKRDESSPVTAIFSWRVEIDGKTVANDTRSVQRASDEDEWLKEEFEIHADEYHRFSVRLRTWQEIANMEITSRFLPPARD